MNEQSATLRDLLQFALPAGASLVVGTPDLRVGWAVMVRAQSPAFPDIYGGELALVSMDIVRSYDNRITLADVIYSLAEVGVKAIAVNEDISQETITIADEYDMSILSFPTESSLTSVERSVNKYIVNQSVLLTQRAVEIQRQLSQLVAENRDLSELLQIIVDAIAKPILLHDETGILMAQVYPNIAFSNSMSKQAVSDSNAYTAFQHWLTRTNLDSNSGIISSPIGFTTVLRVEKRTAGYLSLVTQYSSLEEFDRLVLTYSGDICAIELAKTRAIASAVEQARGDWVQMWLSGASADDDLLATRAQQSGFDSDSEYVVTLFKIMSVSDSPMLLDLVVSWFRDDMGRRHIGGAVGQYVDSIVAIYPIDNQPVGRIRSMIEDVSKQLTTRIPDIMTSIGISRPTQGLSNLREAYREAKDALKIAHELDAHEEVTYYGDLKLYQLLLALKDHNLQHLRRFYDESLAPLVEHDDRKQGELIRTLNGFFESNGNLAKAASDLDVHRNTLVYRLERICALTNLDLDDSDNRLILHLALKIRRVLATIPTD